MLRESEFIRQVRTLLRMPVSGLSEEQKTAILQRLSEQFNQADGAATPQVEWVPFVTGRRPTDEASYPGLGSSDHVALILDGPDTHRNQAYLLFRLENLGDLTPEELSKLDVRVTISLTGPWGDKDTLPLPQWKARSVRPLTLSRSEDGEPELVETSWSEFEQHSFVIPLSPPDDFLPGELWSWGQIDPQIAEGAVDANDPFTFGHLFIQQVRAEIVLLRNGVPESASEQTFDVCDGRRFGSLYRRIVEKVIKPDTETQARERSIESLDFAHHPWFPVLLIGSDKADLYMKALTEDIVHKKRHLTDPRWLLRVGLYLELLTCLGVFEAVKEDLGDLLSPAERTAWETGPAYAPIRKALNVEGWREVWALRKIVTPQVGTPRAGDVSALNLLAKKKATLAFLEVHHEDLKQAIRLAGANDHNSQETWHRVFRDAERAVLRKTPTAFPELSAFPPRAQEFILWHQRGRLAGRNLLPTLSGWFGDQDGLYASACNQYRASMNHVGDWAKAEGLMDHTGDECIPESVSLLRAFMDGKQTRLAQLQRRDGYAGSIDISADLPPAFEVTRQTLLAMLREIPMFTILNDQELETLTTTIRPIELGPVERIIVQGREGSSLFIVADGELEVMIRQEDGTDLPIATLQRGAVFGEMSLLTGERRSATVRSIDSAVIYEIGNKQLAPILEARPVIIDELAAIMEPRLRVNSSAEKKHSSGRESSSLGQRIRTFLFA